MSNITQSKPQRAVRAAGSTAAESQPDYGKLRVVKTKHWWRWTFSAIGGLLIAQFLVSLITNPLYEWGVFAEHFTAKAVLRGLGTTLWLSLVSGTIGLLLGTLLALARLSKSPILGGFAWSFTWFFRSVPLLVQLLVWFNLGYLYPQLGIGIPFTHIYFLQFDTVTLVSAFAAAVLGLSLHQAAFSAEIIRGGILSVDQGQLEAAAALGLPIRRRVLRIVLPQAARSILPNAFNQIIDLIKGTSVVYVLATSELFYVVQVIYNRNGRVIPLLLVAVVWYTVVVTILSVAQFYIERHFARGATRTLPPTPIQAFARWTAIQWNRLEDDPPTPGRPTPLPTKEGK
ncbi:amino acid ABC transporter permease [Saxibacter everestensis]|uniref:Amino acid ABC transporter permease n=1 Tax=Saxibacter everestensis TaxID=2909229 RepID=A0ABY8QPC9_9MICO|nr:amino acid ABC transporter permease [Brevibacteriaceae bacterium ZFBP1038]